MSLFTSLLPVVTGLFGKKDKPATPAAPQVVPLSDFQSALDDPLTSLYAQQALADLGYTATKKVTKGRGMMRVGLQDANKGMYKTNAEVEAGPGNAQAKREWWGWANEPDKTEWQIEQGAEPEAYGRLRENYGNELGAQQAKLFGNMASRGILRSGATADAARQMSQATGTAIANAIEAQRQNALDRLNALVQSERSQQARAASVANANAASQYNAAQDAYNIANNQRTQSINELSELLGGIGNIKFGGRKTNAPLAY